MFEGTGLKGMSMDEKNFETYYKDKKGNLFIKRFLIGSFYPIIFSIMMFDLAELSHVSELGK